MITLTRACTISYEWHGGMSSPLYSFASTRTIHSETHKVNLLREIEDNLAYAESQDHRGDMRSLKALQRFVNAMAVKS